MARLTLAVAVLLTLGAQQVAIHHARAGRSDAAGAYYAGQSLIAAQQSLLRSQAEAIRRLRGQCLAQQRGSP